MGSAHEHRRRDRSRTRRPATRCRPTRRPLPRVPVRRAPSDRRQELGARTASSHIAQEARRGRLPGLRHARRCRRDRRAQWRARIGAVSGRDDHLAERGRRLELVGGERRTHLYRQPSTRKRSPSRGIVALGLDSDAVALQHRERGVPIRCGRLQLLGASGHCDRPQRAHCLGLHEPHHRCRRPLHRTGRRRQLLARRRAARHRRAQRSDQGRGRRRRAARGALDETRPDHLGAHPRFHFDRGSTNCWRRRWGEGVADYTRHHRRLAFR